MIRLVEDVEAVTDAYLDGLNGCFAGWGDRRDFDWCFRRKAGGPAADLFVVEQDGALVAGSAVTYRRVRFGGEGPEPIACMTASWTVPAARGRGLFRQMIDASREQARRRGCRLLIAFAAASNKSASPLAAVNAAILPAAYLTSPESSASDLSPPPASNISSTEAVEAFTAARPFDPGVARFVYTPSEWRGQMIDRPGSVDCLGLSDGSIAVIERKAGVDRLLDVAATDAGAFAEAAGALAALSRSAGRRLFTYSVDADVTAALAERGFATAPGSLYLMPVEAVRTAPEAWWIANGDRM